MLEELDCRKNCLLGQGFCPVHLKLHFATGQKQMPAPEIASTGLCMAPSSVSSSRKEKKKQAKEERDRLKQVEKKKRRLEKALATAAAIRIELEKKKQKRKEEEQRLDEEGAALAEAVALQVLVGEDVDVNSIENSVDGEDIDVHDKDGSIDCESAFEGVSTVQSVGNGLSSSVSKELFRNREASSTCLHGHFERDHFTKLQHMHFCKVTVSEQKVTDSLGDHLKVNTERAKAAELAAGMAAAQAVAALRIAEEARAEAEAAKLAAEAAISHVLDRKQASNSFLAQASFHPKNVELERDELKARLEETERQLKEKTRQVVHLEQNLEDMTHYLLHLKEKMPFFNGGERQGEMSERESANFTESSGGTVDQ